MPALPERIQEASVIRWSHEQSSSSVERVVQEKIAEERRKDGYEGSSHPSKGQVQGKVRGGCTSCKVQAQRDKEVNNGAV